MKVCPYLASMFSVTYIFTFVGKKLFWINNGLNVFIQYLFHINTISKAQWCNKVTIHWMTILLFNNPGWTMIGGLLAAFSVDMHVAAGREEIYVKCCKRVFCAFRCQLWGVTSAMSRWWSNLGKVCLPCRLTWASKLKSSFRLSSINRFQWMIDHSEFFLASYLLLFHWPMYVAKLRVNRQS